MSLIWALNIPYGSPSNTQHFATSITSFGASDTREKTCRYLLHIAKDGEQSERIISPHTLFCTPLRWQVRAYCEQAGGYRDFVLSRILGIPDINNNAIHGKRDDVLWNTKVNVELIPTFA